MEERETEETEETDPVSIYLEEIGRTPLLSREEAAAFIELEKAKKALFKKIILRKPIRARMLIDLKKIALGKGHNPRLNIYDDKDNIRANRKAAKALLEKIRRTRKTSRLWNIIRRSGVYFSLYQLEQWVNVLKNKNSVLKELAETTRIRNAIVNANLRLVVNIAKHYTKKSSMGLLDFIQEGNIGLMKAVSKFSHVLGNKLSTYASWWIRQAITRAVIDKGFTIRIPVHHNAKIRAAYRAWGILVQKNSRKPTVQELAKKLHWPIKNVIKVLSTVRDPKSLNSYVGDDDTELGDLLPDVTTPTPEEEVADKCLGERVRHFLSRLPAKEEGVLKMRSGIDVPYPYDQTLEEVGQQLGVTRERIRQIEEKGLKTLKNIMKREGGRNGRKFFENIKP